MSDRNIRNDIKDLIKSITTFDDLEKEHVEDAIDWIESGTDIFRTQKDAVPPKHLVSYSVVADLDKSKVLLFDHKKAQRMLPSGGHINIDEMPHKAAKRELKEELNLVLDIHPLNNSSDVPFFITVTDTVGISESHTDVSLWYLFNVDSERIDKVDGDEYSKEFDGFKWLGFDEILSSPILKFDPHMHRFIRKIKKYNY